MFGDSLSAEERDALRRITANQNVDAATMRQLEARGLAKQLLGGNAVTGKGKRLLAKGRL